MLVIIVGMAGVLFVYKIVSDIEIRLVDITKEKKQATASEVYDRDNKLIGTFFTEERYYKPLSEISQEFQNSLVSAEDERFYMHKGFDVKGLMRVMWYVVTKPGRPAGASTITQQVARSELYLDQSQRTVKRKIIEIFLAYQLEKKFTKEQILEAYCNQVYFGHNSYGVESASRRYFGKNAKDLNYSESAMLCGLLPAPSARNPLENPELAKKSQINVLRKLRDNGFITDKEKVEFSEYELEYKRYTDIGYRDNINFFIDFVKSEVLKLVSDPTILEEGGLKIYTTLNWNYQQHAEASIEEFYESKFKAGSFRKNYASEKGIRQPQSSLVAMDPKTGAILAMMGGRDYNESEFNRAISPQPPGSSFKIFDYTCAIENRSLTGGSLLMSDDFTIDGYTPGEWNRGTGRFEEELVRQALIDSSNICALRAALRPGLYKVAYFANKMGITTQVDPYPSMTVGSMDVRAIDMATAYGCLATNGYRNDSYAVEFIETPDGREIYRHQVHPVKVISEETSWIMTNLLQSVHFQKGWGSLGFDLAGKTGTSGEKVAGWYCCYSPDIVTIAYTGVDDKTLKKAFIGTPWGSSVGVPLAKKFLFKCKDDPDYPIPKSKFSAKPKGVVSATVCKQSGHLVTEYCPEGERATNYFLEGTVPTNYCQFHAEPTRLFQIVIGENGEYFRRYNAWCPTTSVKMTQREYDALLECDPSLCPPLLEDIRWEQPDIEGSEIQYGDGDELMFVSEEGVIRASINLKVSENIIDSVDTITLFFGDMQVHKWKIDAYDIGGVLAKEDFVSGLSCNIQYFLPPEGDQSEVKIVIKLNGPKNYYNHKDYVATIINP
jgi:membrane peptidoglycan carboxypeptidase